MSNLEFITPQYKNLYYLYKSEIINLKSEFRQFNKTLPNTNDYSKEMLLRDNDYLINERIKIHEALTNIIDSLDDDYLTKRVFIRLKAYSTYSLRQKYDCSGIPYPL